jgi:hypothetical protein
VVLGLDVVDPNLDHVGHGAAERWLLLIFDMDIA